MFQFDFAHVNNADMPIEVDGIKMYSSKGCIYIEFSPHEDFHMTVWVCKGRAGVKPEFDSETLQTEIGANWCGICQIHEE